VPGPFTLAPLAIQGGSSKEVDESHAPPVSEEKQGVILTVRKGDTRRKGEPKRREGKAEVREAKTRSYSKCG